MKPGPKPKPAFLKLLAGNPGKRKLGRNPEPTGRPGPAPRYLCALARREYKRLVETCPWVTAADAGIVEGAAAQYAIWRDALTKMATTGTTYTAGTGLEKVHPVYQVLQASGTLYLRLCAELGATPANRTRVHTTEIKAVDDLTQWQEEGN